jgi:hypothetical protein
MRKNYEDVIEYVKPKITDLGAMTIVYGRCQAGGTAAGGGSDCTSGPAASGGGTAENCPAGSVASCVATGGSPGT